MRGFSSRINCPTSIPPERAPRHVRVLVLQGRAR